MGIFASDIFGEIEYKDENVISIDEGLFGFPKSKKYILIPHENIEVFYWLHSLDETGLCFLTTSPHLFFPDYKPEFIGADKESLGLDQNVIAEVLVLITVPENTEDMTANLAGPILLNQKSVKARQVVIKNTEYGTKHRLLAEIPEEVAVVR